MSQLVVGHQHTPLSTPSHTVPWGWWDIGRALTLLIGGVLFLSILVLVALLILVFTGRDLDIVIMANLISIAFYGIVLLSTYWSTVRRYGSPWAALGLRRIAWWWLLASPACFGGLLLIAMVIQQVTPMITGQPFYNPQVQMLTQGQFLRPIDLALLLLCGALVGPIVEELFFRGMLYPVMRRHAPAWVAIVLNAAVFAVLHFIPSILPMLFVSGVVYALVRERTGSLLPGILIHCVQNAVFVIWLYTAFHN